MTMTVAIMARWPALVGAATGPPDLDHFRLGSYLGRGFRGNGVRCGNGVRGGGFHGNAGVGGGSFAGNSRFACDLGSSGFACDLCQRLVDGLILKLVFRRLRFNGRRRLLARHRRDIGKQCRATARRSHRWSPPQQW